MKLTTKDLIDDRNLIGHIVLGGIGKHPAMCEAIREAGEADLRLTVNGKEIDLQEFVDHWQSQVKRIITERALEMVDEKFNSMRDKMSEFTSGLEEALQSMREEQ